MLEIKEEFFMSQSTCDNFIQKIEDIFSKISDAENFINPDYIHDFENKIRRAKKHSQDILNINRDLKIGIVGQVKAGKSSFLNALVFDGQDILPKAATPMTAALTKISYSDKSSAKVVFYSESDWQVIEENSLKYDEEFKREKASFLEGKKARLQQNKGLGGTFNAINTTLTATDLQIVEKRIPSQYRSCKELTDMAKKSADIFSKLGNEEKISVVNLQNDLEHCIYTYR